MNFFVFMLKRKNRVQFIDMLEMREPCELPNVRNCSLTILRQCNTIEEAQTHRDELRRQHGVEDVPAMRYHRTPILCINTGKQYATASHAADANDISCAALSLHLNTPGKYPDVKGLKFERIRQ